MGQIIGDVLKQLDDDRFIVKASSGPRYVVGCRNKLDKAALKPGTRVSLDMTTLTIMRKLPREVGDWVACGETWLGMCVLLSAIDDGVRYVTFSKVVCCSR